MIFKHKPALHLKSKLFCLARIFVGATVVCVKATCNREWVGADPMEGVPQPVCEWELGQDYDTHSDKALPLSPQTHDSPTQPDGPAGKYHKYHLNHVNGSVCVYL